jgi:hypothetical protein
MNLDYRGDEAAMADIFGMARRFSPCMLVLEDIDSHINERWEIPSCVLSQLTFLTETGHSSSTKFVYAYRQFLKDSNADLVGWPGQ